MSSAGLYVAALERASQPDTPTDRNNERYDIPPVSEADRAGCEKWLQKVGFLCPGEDDETWMKIKRNWVGFLSATSLMPDATLAPNRKAVRFTSGSGVEEESEREKKKQFRDDRRQRMTIQAAFWNKLDGLEAMTERWPRTVRAAMNIIDKGEDQGAFETLVAIWDLNKRRRYQAVWTSLVGFMVRSHDEYTLEEIGLKLNEDQIDDILDVMQEVWNVDLKDIGREEGVFDRVWATIQQLLTKALEKKRSTARNNPLVWWMAILVRSAVSGETDFISSERFNKNPMPMDIDIRERLGATVHYSKVLILDNAFRS